MNEVERSILGHLGEIAAGSKVTITRDTKLLDSGLLDSINLVGLIQFLEEQFSLKIADTDLGPELFASPATVIAYVERRLGITPSPEVASAGA